MIIRSSICQDLRDCESSWPLTHLYPNMSVFLSKLSSHFSLKQSSQRHVNKVYPSKSSAGAGVLRFKRSSTRWQWGKSAESYTWKEKEKLSTPGGTQAFLAEETRLLTTLGVPEEAAVLPKLGPVDQLGRGTWASSRM